MWGQNQTGDSEGGWIKTGKSTNDESTIGQVGDSSDAEGASHFFKLPENGYEYPMWLLSVPWYAAFSLTVPDCTKVDHFHGMIC